MSDDWKPGDLALCVRGGHVRGPHGGGNPTAGAVYTVAGTWHSPLWNKLFLVLADGPDNCGIGPKWAAFRFRKIHPLSIEERNAEIRLLNETPAKEPAERARRLAVKSAAVGRAA